MSFCLPTSPQKLKPSKAEVKRKVTNLLGTLLPVMLVIKLVHLRGAIQMLLNQARPQIKCPLTLINRKRKLRLAMKEFY